MANDSKPTKLSTKTVKENAEAELPVPPQINIYDRADIQSFIGSGHVTKHEVLSHVWKDVDEGIRYLQAAHDKGVSFQELAKGRIKKAGRHKNIALGAEVFLMTIFTHNVFKKVFGVEGLEGTDQQIADAQAWALSLFMSSGRVFAQYKCIDAALKNWDQGNKNMARAYAAMGLGIAGLHSIFVAFQMADMLMHGDTNALSEEIAKLSEQRQAAVDGFMAERDATGLENNPTYMALVEENKALRAEFMEINGANGMLGDGIVDNDAYARQRVAAINETIESNEAQLKEMRSNVSTEAVDTSEVTQAYDRQIAMKQNRMDAITGAKEMTSWFIFESPKTGVETVSAGAALSLLNVFAAYSDHEKERLENLPYAQPKNTANPLRRNDGHEVANFMGFKLENMDGETCLRNIRFIDAALDDVLNPERVVVAMKENVRYQINLYRGALTQAYKDDVINKKTYTERLKKLNLLLAHSINELDTKATQNKVRRYFIDAPEPPKAAPEHEPETLSKAVKKIQRAGEDKSLIRRRSPNESCGPSYRATR